MLGAGGDFVTQRYCPSHLTSKHTTTISNLTHSLEHQLQLEQVLRANLEQLTADRDRELEQVRLRVMTTPNVQQELRESQISAAMKSLELEKQKFKQRGPMEAEEGFSSFPPESIEPHFYESGEALQEPQQVYSDSQEGETDPKLYEVQAPEVEECFEEAAHVEAPAPDLKGFSEGLKSNKKPFDLEIKPDEKEGDVSVDLKPLDDTNESIFKEALEACLQAHKKSLESGGHKNDIDPWFESIESLELDDRWEEDLPTVSHDFSDISVDQDHDVKQQTICPFQEIGGNRSGSNRRDSHSHPGISSPSGIRVRRLSIDKNGQLFYIDTEGDKVFVDSEGKEIAIEPEGNGVAAGIKSQTLDPLWANKPAAEEEKEVATEKISRRLFPSWDYTPAAKEGLEKQSKTWDPSGAYESAAKKEKEVASEKLSRRLFPSWDYTPAAKEGLEKQSNTLDPLGAYESAAREGLAKYSKTLDPLGAYKAKPMDQEGKEVAVEEEELQVLQTSSNEKLPILLHQAPKPPVDDYLIHRSQEFVMGHIPSKFLPEACKDAVEITHAVRKDSSGMSNITRRLSTAILHVKKSDEDIGLKEPLEQMLSGSPLNYKATTPKPSYGGVTALKSRDNGVPTTFPYKTQTEFSKPTPAALQLSGVALPATPKSQERGVAPFVSLKSQEDRVTFKEMGVTSLPTIKPPGVSVSSLQPPRIPDITGVPLNSTNSQDYKKTIGDPRPCYCPPIVPTSKIETFPMFPTSQQMRTPAPVISSVSGPQDKELEAPASSLKPAPLDEDEAILQDERLDCFQINVCPHHPVTADDKDQVIPQDERLDCFNIDVGPHFYTTGEEFKGMSTMSSKCKTPAPRDSSQFPYKTTTTPSKTKACHDISESSVRSKAKNTAGDLNKFCALGFDTEERTGNSLKPHTSLLEEIAPGVRLADEEFCIKSVMYETTHNTPAGPIPESVPVSEDFDSNGRVSAEDVDFGSNSKSVLEPYVKPCEFTDSQIEKSFYPALSHQTLGSKECVFPDFSIPRPILLPPLTSKMKDTLPDLDFLYRLKSTEHYPRKGDSIASADIRLIEQIRSAPSPPKGILRPKYTESYQRTVPFNNPEHYITSPSKVSDGSKRSMTSDLGCKVICWDETPEKKSHFTLQELSQCDILCWGLDHDYDNFGPKLIPSRGQPESFYKNDQPESFNKNDQPESFNKNDQPESFNKNDQPESFNKNDQPESFNKNDQPESFYKNDQPESFYKNDQPESFNRSDQAESFYKSDQPESFNKIDQPESFNKIDQPESFNKIDQPKSFNRSDQAESLHKVGQPGSIPSMNKMPQKISVVIDVAELPPSPADCFPQYKQLPEHTVPRTPPPTPVPLILEVDNVLSAKEHPLMKLQNSINSGMDCHILCWDEAFIDELMTAPIPDHFPLEDVHSDFECKVLCWAEEPLESKSSLLSLAKSSLESLRSISSEIGCRVVCWAESLGVVKKSKEPVGIGPLPSASTCEFLCWDYEEESGGAPYPARQLESYYSWEEVEYASITPREGELPFSLVELLTE
uniref:Uncharacterized protein n=1 Tax=Timema tahoe TaxID=61484 RepID=A0A7R9IKZ6_9NEOP|nr:unnamed protein product [Timema tahoe]